MNIYIPDDVWSIIKKFIIIPNILAIKNFRKLVLPSLPKYIPLLFIPRRTVIYCSKRKIFLFFKKNIEYMKYMKTKYIVTLSNN